MTKEIQKSSSKYIVTAVFAAIAVALYWFWAFPYRAALGYREEMQLFQTTGTYFAGFALRPAGISIYIGEFLTQFFNNYWIGGAVMSLLMVLFGWACYLICNLFAKKGRTVINLLLSLIPLIFLWLFLGNQNVTLGFITALLIVTFGAYIYISTDADYTGVEKYLRLIVATTLLYWLAGPCTIVFTLLVIASGYISQSARSVAEKAIDAILAIITIIANIYIWSRFITYPISYQLIGIGYLLTPDVLKGDQLIIEALCVIVPTVAYLMARGDASVKRIVPILIFFLIVPAVRLYFKAYDKNTYRLIDYDYMVRANDWNGILRYSDKHKPDQIISVSATNLASGMTGQLDSRAFDYYQNGPEGLIPPFSKETISSWTTGEIFFQLGMINSAQRLYFEGMEAIPNYNKSSRAVKRLAETAIILCEYRLAEKYLRMLENTIFYRKWAQRNLQQIKDLTAISPPLYGQMRQRMLDEDYLFSETELDKTLQQLFIKDPGNDLARQYLILYPLLQRDLDMFVQHMGVVAQSLPQYNPLLAQQALAFISMKNRQPIPQNIVSPMVEQSLHGFAKAWTSKNHDLIEPYRHTLYHYLISNE